MDQGVAPEVAPAAPVRVSFNDVPRVAESDWWRRHQHLFEYRQRLGVLQFEPGVAGGAADPPVVPGPRPKVRGLGELVGQDRIREHLQVAIRSALGSNEQLGHLLLLGPPGLGKTSFARAVARDLGGTFESVLAPIVRDASVLVGLLTSLSPGSVLFLDEVHRLPARAAEVLYDALERRRIDLPIRCGSRQRTLTLELAPFTLVAATTEEGLLPEPFLSRFVYQERLEFYDRVSMLEIVERAELAKGLSLTRRARELIVEAARDTPRVAISLLQAVCDEARAAGRSRVTGAIVSAALARVGTSRTGVTAGEAEYLRVLDEAGGRAGLSTLAAKLGSSRQSVQRSLEPFLLRRGLVRTTPGGRRLTLRGRMVADSRSSGNRAWRSGTAA